MTVTIDQQIRFLTEQIRYMKASLPRVVESGRISEETATHRIVCAQAAFQTLTQLRGLAHSTEVSNG